MTQTLAMQSSICLLMNKVEDDKNKYLQTTG